MSLLVGPCLVLKASFETAISSSRLTNQRPILLAVPRGLRRRTNSFFALRQSQFQKHDKELFKMDFVYNLQFFTNSFGSVTDRDPKSTFRLCWDLVGIQNFGCPNSMNMVLYRSRRSRYLGIFDNFD